MKIELPLALAASAFTASASIMLRAAAAPAPGELRFSWRLVAFLLHRPLWFLGIVCMILGFLFQLAALRFGDLALVEPIVASELLFVFVYLALRFRGDIRAVDVVAAAAMAASLAGFLYAADPTGGSPTSADAASWWLAGGAVGVAAASAAVLSAVTGPSGRAPTPARRADLSGRGGVRSTTVAGVFCHNCGHRNPSGVNFCSSCGAALAASTDTTISFVPDEPTGDVGEDELALAIGELPEGLNPAKHPAWGEDSFLFFPNFMILIWKPNWYLTYHYWPTSYNTHIFETSLYFVPPTNAFERLQQELAVVTFKEYGMQDGNTLEATQTMIESGVVREFPLNDQEIALRHLHRTARQYVAEHQGKRSTATPVSVSAAS